MDMNSSVIVANRFLELADAKNDKLTPMQLLKLVYIAHGWMLGLYGRPLIKDKVEAWQYGPVIPALYQHVRKYKGAPVTKKISTYFEVSDMDALEDDVVSQVYGAYGSKPGMQLSRITHAQGTPWELTYEDGSFGLTIPTDIIEDHYKKLAEQSA
jgi:uncharacterized phage-associated protein